MSEQTSTQATPTPLFKSLEAKPVDLRALLLGVALSPLICGSILLAFGNQSIHVYAAKSPAVPDPSIPKQTKTHPQMTFSSQPTPVEQTVKVNITMTTPAGAPIPTGTVNVLYGWTFVGKGTLVNGSVTMPINIPDQKHLPLNAIYTGDENYLSANSFESNH